MSSFSSVLAAVALLAVVLLNSSTAERYEEVLRGSDSQDEGHLKGTTPSTAATGGTGQDVIGYIVVPYPGPYPGLQSRNDFSSLFSLFNPANLARSYSKRSKASTRVVNPLANQLANPLANHLANPIVNPLAALNALGRFNGLTNSFGNLNYPAYAGLNGYHSMGGFNVLNGLNALQHYGTISAQNQLRQSLLALLGR